MDDIAYMTALQAELRRSTRNELVSLFQEAIKRRAAGETLASIAKSYGVSRQTIRRLSARSEQDPSKDDGQAHSLREREARQIERVGMQR